MNTIIYIYIIIVSIQVLLNIYFDYNNFLLCFYDEDYYLHLYYNNNNQSIVEHIFLLRPERAKRAEGSILLTFSQK